MERKKQWRWWLRRLAPWVISALIVAVLLHRYSLEGIVEAMARPEALAMVPIAVALAFASLGVASIADTMVLRVLVGELGYGTVFRAKAAASLMGLVGYAVGHGGYAVWIARRGGTGALRATGIILYVMSSDLAAVCLVATAAVWLGGAEVPAAIRIAAPAIAGVMLLLKAVGPLRLFGERSPRVFRPWSELSRRRAYGQVVIRAANIYLGCAGVWVALGVFGLEVPFWAVAVYLPVILLVGSLPINVAGFGAVQAAWLLFEPWGTGEEILAFQFLWQLMMGLGIVLRGLPFVRRVLAELDEGGAKPGSRPEP